jgi:hypothetical protein
MGRDDGGEWDGIEEHGNVPAATDQKQNVLRLKPVRFTPSGKLRPNQRMPRNGSVVLNILHLDSSGRAIGNFLNAPPKGVGWKYVDNIGQLHDFVSIGHDEDGIELPKKVKG